MDARAAGQTRREQLLKAMDTAGSGALLLALAALCTRAVLTGGHPGLMALAAGAVCLGMGWRRWASRRRLLDAQLAQALERHEAALIRCYRQGRRGQPVVSHPVV